MRVTISSEHRFLRTPDGSVWTETSHAYQFWTRYLGVFEVVRVFARVLDVPTVSVAAQRADGPHVSFLPVPHFLGPLQYALKWRSIRSSARTMVNGTDAVIMRVGCSQIANSIEPILREKGRSYGIEVIGDPYAAFAPGAFDHALRRFFRWWYTGHLRRQCATACAVAYVTENVLQRRYPTAGFSIGVSDVELSPDALIEGKSRFDRLGMETVDRPRIIITVGSLEQAHKGVDVLIRAVAGCLQRNEKIHLVVIGDGRMRSSLELLVDRLGIRAGVSFKGQMPAGQSIRDELDKSDLFVLASRTEGLPRAMVEAMGRGLPCLGTDVGGMPELLNKEDLVPPDDARALSQAIENVLSDPARMERMAHSNLRAARRFRSDLLNERRASFLQRVRRESGSLIAGNVSTP